MFKSGPEFGSEFIGKLAIIVRSYYGLKSARAGFWNHIRECMEYLGYDSSNANPDVWMRPETRIDGLDYYEYILLYVDDC